MPHADENSNLIARPGPISRRGSVGIGLSLEYSRLDTVRSDINGAHHSPMRGSMDERVARLTEVLQLDEAQQSAVKKILEQRRQEFWRIRHAPSLSGNEPI